MRVIIVLALTGLLAIGFAACGGDKAGDGGSVTEDGSRVSDVEEPAAVEEEAVEETAVVDEVEANTYTTGNDEVGYISFPLAEGAFVYEDELKDATADTYEAGVAIGYENFDEGIIYLMWQPVEDDVDQEEIDAFLGGSGTETEIVGENEFLITTLDDEKAYSLIFEDAFITIGVSPEMEGSPELEAFLSGLHID
ncbi:MAG: hypothetical protein LBR44_07425 [Clostridiales Family XIII bacterium]|jgi:hypothetical protein|nr:hypothetical protein [Clostridiales Family XIII bacterium]